MRFALEKQERKINTKKYYPTKDYSVEIKY